MSVSKFFLVVGLQFQFFYSNIERHGRMSRKMLVKNLLPSTNKIKMDYGICFLFAARVISTPLEANSKTYGATLNVISCSKL